MDKALGIDSPGVPTIIIGNVALVGEDQIRDRLDATIQQELASPTDRKATANSTVTENCPGTVSSLTVPLVIVCAGIASINPCGLAVLVILLLSIIALQTRRAGPDGRDRLHLIGLFVLSYHGPRCPLLYPYLRDRDLVVYCNSGGGDSDRARPGEHRRCCDEKGGFLLAIPESKKPVIERYIRTATLPAAVVLGVLVGIFELPCAGGIYLVILGLVSNTMTLSQGIPYLLLYNFIFVLPMIVILLVVVFGLPPERVNTWRLSNRRDAQGRHRCRHGPRGDLYPCRSHIHVTGRNRPVFIKSCKKRMKII